MCGEDVEDQRRAVDDLDADPVLQVAELGERQLAVADHRVCAGRDHDVPQLGNLAAPDVGSRVRSVASLDQALEDLRSGGLGQQLEFGDGILSAHLAAGGPDADQHDALQEQLAVLDLGDVGQLGRHPGDSAQGQPILEILLISVDVWGADWSTARAARRAARHLVWWETVGRVGELSCPNQNLTATQVAAKRFVRTRRRIATRSMCFQLSEEGVAAVNDQDRAGHER